MDGRHTLLTRPSLLATNLTSFSSLWPAIDDLEVLKRIGGGGGGKGSAMAEVEGGSGRGGKGGARI